MKPLYLVVVKKLFKSLSRNIGANPINAQLWACSWSGFSLINVSTRTSVESSIMSSNSSACRDEDHNFLVLITMKFRSSRGVLLVESALGFSLFSVTRSLFVFCLIGVHPTRLFEYLSKCIFRLVEHLIGCLVLLSSSVMRPCR